LILAFGTEKKYNKEMKKVAATRCSYKFVFDSQRNRINILMIAEAKITEFFLCEALL
jgi:hypothetical protein